MAPCTVCGLPVDGHPDTDVCCQDCERLNLAGDPLRMPRRRDAHPLPWWQQERLPLAPRRDGLRALTCIQGPWTWTPENGVEEDNHV
jgi:hypothetical protein